MTTTLLALESYSSARNMSKIPSDFEPNGLNFNSQLNNVIGNNCKSEAVLNSIPKLDKMLEKITTIMLHIRTNLDKGIPPPDGAEDFLRRTKRTAEFSSRFSRNYIYRFVQQLNKMEKDCEIQNETRPQDIVSIFQTIIQAIQLYSNYLPSSIGECSTDKLKSFLFYTITFCEFQIEKCTLFVDHMEILKQQTDCLLETIEAFHVKMVTPQLSYIVDNSSKIAQKSLIKKSTVRKIGHRPVSGRYSMYNNTFRRNRRTPTSLVCLPPSMKTTKKNLQNNEQKQTILAPQNSCKQAASTASRHNNQLPPPLPPPPPPPQSHADTEQLSPGATKKSHTTTANGKKRIIQRSPIVSPIFEDTIETIVEDHSKKNPIDDYSMENIMEMVYNDTTTTNSRTDNTSTTTDNEQKPIKEKKCKKCRQHDKQLETNGILYVKKQHLKGAEYSQRKYSRQSSSSGLKHEDGKEKKYTITECGAPNAKLICIKELFEPQVEPNNNQLVTICCGKNNMETNTEPMLLDEVSVVLKQSLNGTQESSSVQEFAPIIDEKLPLVVAPRPILKSSKKFQNTIKRREKSSGKPIEMLERHSAISLLQYKLDFNAFCKQNCMYVKKENFEPGAIVKQITDDIFDQLLADVVDEIDFDKICQKVYQSEMTK